jgi:hypothetical protein
MITDLEMSYLENYDASANDALVEHFKVKDLFSKAGRERITEEIKDKHPKVKKALDKHPILEKAVKTAMAYEAAMVGMAALTVGAAAAYYGAGAIGAGSAGSLAVFKPAMQASLKAKGQATNGLSLKEIAAKFMQANGKKSTDAKGDFSFISEYFAKKMEKVKSKGGTDEDKLFNNLIDGTANAIQEKGANFLKDLITGDDAAPDSPLASKEDNATGGGMGSNKNMMLILGAIVLVLFFANRK